MKCIGYSSSSDSSTHDGVRKRSTQIQVFEGTTVGVWEVISTAPVRDTKNVLVWVCKCVNGHVRNIANTELSYSIAPTKCMACIEAELQARSASKVNERRVLKECLYDVKAARIAQFEQEKQENQDVS